MIIEKFGVGVSTDGAVRVGHEEFVVDDVVEDATTLVQQAAARSATVLLFGAGADTALSLVEAAGFASASCCEVHDDWVVEPVRDLLSIDKVQLCKGQVRGLKTEPLSVVREAWGRRHRGAHAILSAGQFAVVDVARHSTPGPRQARARSALRQLVAGNLASPRDSTLTHILSHKPDILLLAFDDGRRRASSESTARPARASLDPKHLCEAYEDLEREHDARGLLVEALEILALDERAATHAACSAALAHAARLERDVARLTDDVACLEDELADVHAQLRFPVHARVLDRKRQSLATSNLPDERASSSADEDAAPQEQPDFDPHNFDDDDDSSGDDGDPPSDDDAPSPLGAFLARRRPLADRNTLAVLPDYEAAASEFVSKKPASSWWPRFSL